MILQLVCRAHLASWQEKRVVIINYIVRNELDFTGLCFFAADVEGGAQIELTRWDLFHAHCFITPKDRGVGLLFHAKEYPRECEAFPYNLGYCQRGSPLEYSEREMDFRNLIYYQVRIFPEPLYLCAT